MNEGPNPRRTTGSVGRREAYYGEPYAEAKRLADMAPQDFCALQGVEGVQKRAFGDLQKWGYAGYPHSWLVDFMENPIVRNGFGGTPIYGNPHFKQPPDPNVLPL